jgi:hypothetical protein
MNNKRDQRQNVMKAGTILFGYSGIDCLVRNISDGVANLEVESQIGIPNSFDLVIVRLEKAATDVPATAFLSHMVTTRRSHRTCARAVDPRLPLRGPEMGLTAKGTKV